MVYEKEIDFLLNYDYTEIEKIPGQISSIDETTKAILQELQKDPTDPTSLDSPEPTEFQLKILEAIESNTIESKENPADTPVQSIVLPEVVAEETTEEATGEEAAKEEATEEEAAKEEVPEEEAVTEETAEEVLEEEVLEEELPVEEPIDYLQLMYEEMKVQNETTVQLTEQLEAMQIQNDVSNHADHVLSTYGLIIIPGLIIIYALNKLIKPFTSYSSY